MSIADWPQVDRLAQRLGVAIDDPSRMVAAVESVLYSRLRDQHTWTLTTLLALGVSKLLAVPEQVAHQAILTASCHGAAWSLDDGWQPAGAAMMESYVADRLGTAILSDGAQKHKASKELSTLISGHGRFDDELPIKLNDEQKAAVCLALTERFSLVLGGAGVGKTTVLRIIVSATEQAGHAVYLMALSGRAAAKMQETTGRPSSTIAAFLARTDNGQLRVKIDDLVVIDEASMVDLASLYRVFRKLPNGCRVVLVGDEAQLGPIGFGLTLHALAEVEAVPKVRLQRIYRQAASSIIPSVAAAVRAGRLPKLSTSLSGNDGVVLIETKKAPRTEDVVDVLADIGGFEDDLRIVAPMKAGEAGVESLNAHLHAILCQERSHSDKIGFALGEPVIFGRNDYRSGLRNGSLGRIVDVGNSKLLIDFEGQIHRLFGAEIKNVSLAYAITVHKAQGPQFNSVVMPIVASRMIDRSLVYTALTRAVQRMVFVNERSTLVQAVERLPAASKRMVGLESRVRSRLSDRTIRPV